MEEAGYIAMAMKSKNFFHPYKIGKLFKIKKNNYIEVVQKSHKKSSKLLVIY